MRGMIVVLAVFVLAACEGPTGPEGPQGSQGPAGEDGPGTRITFTGAFDEEGEATVSLPSEAGDLANLPVIACYESSTGDTWGIVSDGWDDSDSTVCLVTENSAGDLIVVFIRGIPAWLYFVSVVY